MRSLFVVALFVGCASQTPTAPVTEAVVVQEQSPAPEASSWRDRVNAAKALTDEAARNEAILKLLQEALDPHEVRMSGTSNATNVDVADNQPAPIINFDPKLQEKQSAPPRGGGATRSLKNNFGYYFSKDGKGYVVLGPAALDRRDPIFTQLSAEHELFHAMNHVGDSRSLDDRELETWSTMFETFFTRVHTFRQQWAPMLHYYDDATEKERAAAIERLLRVYQSGDDTIRESFEDWLSRRQKDHASSRLIADLAPLILGQTPD